METTHISKIYQLNYFTKEIGKDAKDFGELSNFSLANMGAYTLLKTHAVEECPIYNLWKYVGKPRGKANCKDSSKVCEQVGYIQ